MAVVMTGGWEEVIWWWVLVGDERKVGERLYGAR
jgi:hypothetical protein